MTLSISVVDGIFLVVSKQSRLIELHRIHGAVLADRDDWLLPVHFGSPAAEYASVRSGVGLMDLSDRALLTLSGPDRLSYLQGMISNDLLTLSSGEGLYATFLNQQGKVLGDCRVLCADDCFFLDLWEPIKQKIIDHMNRYLVADDVEISDLSDRYGIFTVQGPQAEAVLQNFVSKGTIPQKTLDHAVMPIDGDDMRVIRYSHTGEDGFDLVVPLPALEKLARRLTAISDNYSGKWIGAEAQEVLRIEAGIPRYAVDVTEDNLILETGLNHAVSFTKGCYLGQEVVERIRSRGHVNKKLVGLFLEGEKAEVGDRLMASDRNVGIITSSVVSPALHRPIALAYVHRDYWSPGTSLSVTRKESRIQATVTGLPFVPEKARDA
jgi:aminomethyltransferase